MSKKKGTPGASPSASASSSTAASPSISPSASAVLNGSGAEAAAQPPIGISLGTTYCCVAFFKDGRPQVVANEDGERVTPCCVAFTEEEIFAGTAAKTQIVRNRQNTVIEFTKLLGKKFEEIEPEIKEWSHKVINIEGKPVIEVEHKGQPMRLTPEEVTTIMLKKMKETAELYLGLGIRDVTISIPTGSTEAQKKAIIQSAENADLKVLALVKEPVASLLSFGIGQTPEEFSIDRNVLVFDLGGNHLDVALISSFGGLFEIVASASEKLGGKDFDQKITEHFAKEFKRKHQQDIESNTKALAKLRYAAEHTKRTLSNSASAHISVESLHDGIDFHSSINRPTFDMVSGSLTRRCLGVVQSVLDEADLSSEDVHEVILVGGGTAITSVQKFLEAFFPDSKVRRDVSPDESIACGGAVEASIIEEEKNIFHDQFSTKAVPATIGVSDAEGNLVPVIARHSPVPVRRKTVLSTSADNQTSVLVALYSGQSKIAKENVHVADIVISGIAPAPKGTPQVEISITVEETGQLKITAAEQTSGKTVNLAVSAP